MLYILPRLLKFICLVVSLYAHCSFIHSRNNHLIPVFGQVLIEAFIGIVAAEKIQYTKDSLSTAIVLSKSVCVCVCVCVRARALVGEKKEEGEKERKGEFP